MAGISSHDIRNAEFRSSIRGVDKAEVEAYLNRVAALVDRLNAEKKKLAEQAAEAASRDLETEFGALGEEVVRILQAAREAADSITERASVDAARRRGESMAEADATRREAAADAESLRNDAWGAGSALLESVETESARLREQAERDVLTVMGEAEREAHRLTSGARREAEDLLRTATMDAEKTATEAAKKRDEVIRAAKRRASAAAERARALEERRDELLDELENVRNTLTRLEGSLEQRRDEFDLARSPDPRATVRVVTPQEVDVEDWAPGETVRIVQQDAEDPERSGKAAADGDDERKVTPTRIVAEPDPAMVRPGLGESQAEPEEADQTQGAEPETDGAGDEEPEPAGVEEPEPAGVEEPEPAGVDDETVPGSGESGDDVGALFASLRQGGESRADKTPATALAEESARPSSPPGRHLSTAPVEESPKAGPSAREASAEYEPFDAPADWLERRDALLLPITNRALRGAKKSITELQNIALDNLRTESEWAPSTDAIADAVHADVIGLWTESFAAGHSAAEEMTASKIKRPPTPSTEAETEIAEALTRAVSEALGRAGGGPREKQSAVSKVFRVWRTDEAERRVRELAITGYEQGIEASVRMTTDRASTVDSAHS